MKFVNYILFSLLYLSFIIPAQGNDNYTILNEAVIQNTDLEALILHLKLNGKEAEEFRSIDARFQSRKLEIRKMNFSGNRAEMMARMKTLKEEKEKAIQTLLSEDQFVRYQRYQEEQANKRSVKNG